jgi:putative tryptophan/tyrosine transport system substrate-binding protein
MRRREFISLLGGAAAWPLAARAQQAATPVIGFLDLGTAASIAPQIEGLRRGLNETGYVDGSNLTIEFRWSEGQFDRLPSLAVELIRLRPAVIFAHGPPTVMALKQRTKSIPVVFSMGEDPVKEGLVASLNRPGGNITGFTNFQNLLGAKKLGLLIEIVPNATIVGLLVNPNNPNAEPDAKDVQAAADALGRETAVFTASAERELDPAFAAMLQRQVGALIVNVDPVFVDRRQKIVALAAAHAIPAIYHGREFPHEGGLMSYGANEVEAFHQAGIYIGRILKGAKPADLPVQQPTKFEFVINLKTAKTLGLTFPPGLLAIADEVIE